MTKKATRVQEVKTTGFILTMFDDGSNEHLDVVVARINDSDHGPGIDIVVDEGESRPIPIRFWPELRARIDELVALEEELTGK